MQRDGSELVLGPRERHRDGDPSVRQVPSRNQPSAAVATSAGQDDHAGGPEQALGEVGQAAPGVLHHLDEVDAELLDHGSIDLAHLIGRDGRDSAGGDPRLGRLLEGHADRSVNTVNAGQYQYTVQVTTMRLPRHAGGPGLRPATQQRRPAASGRCPSCPVPRSPGPAPGRR